VNHSAISFAAKYVKVDDLKAARARLIGGGMCLVDLECAPKRTFTGILEYLVSWPSAH
jgi:RAB protein geranylgeranyltransferase component A